MKTSLPIACTLTPGGYTARTAWIADLNRAFLRSHHQHDLSLHLVYDPQATAQIRELIQREQECCAFLHFSLQEAPDAIRLSIQAPTEARGGVALLFAPFVAGAPLESAGASNVVEGEEGVGRMAGVAGATSAGIAVACGVCCVLPFAFPAVALTGLGSAFAVFGSFYSWARDVAVISVTVGWLWLGWRSRHTGRRIGSSTLGAMTLATLFLGAALSWPFIESHVIAALRP